MMLVNLRNDRNVKNERNVRNDKNVMNEWNVINVMNVINVNHAPLKTQRGTPGIIRECLSL